jgi:hypothetical protein
MDQLDAQDPQDVPAPRDAAGGLPAAPGRPGPVAVVVQTTGWTSALLFGAHEARRRGLDLQLVATGLLDSPLVRSRVSPDDRQPDDRRRRLEALLERARTAADGLVDGHAVSTRVESGPVVEVLVALSAGCELLVVQHGGRGLDSDSWSLRTARGLAHAASCPVVAVPGTWRPGTAAPRVVAGLEVTRSGHDVLVVAQREAELRGARLEVVRVTRVSRLVRGGEPELWGSAVCCSAGHSRTAEGLEVHDVMTTGTVASALAQLAEGAALLVVRRDASALWHGGRDTVTDLMRACRVPLVVVGHADARTTPTIGAARRGRPARLAALR